MKSPYEGQSATRVRPWNFEGEGRGGKKEGRQEGQDFFFAGDVEKSPPNSLSFSRILSGELDLRHCKGE